MDLESTLTLQLAPRSNVAFRRLLGRLAQGAAPSFTQVRVYYDTPSQALYQRGLSLCLQQQADQWQQIVQWPGRVHPALMQSAQRITVAEQALALDRISSGKVRRLLLRPDLATALEPLFTIRSQCQCWLLDDGLGNRLQVCLEQGVVKGKPWSGKLNQVQITLLHGHHESLFALVLELARALPLQPVLPAGAAGACVQAAGIAASVPVRAVPPIVSRQMSTTQAWWVLLQEVLCHLQGNVAGVLADHDREFTHQARVALHRLRALQVVFASMLPDRAWRRIKPELQWLSQCLGQLRDVDVFLAETLPAVGAGLQPADNLTSLRSAMLVRREQSHQAAHAALISPRYAVLLLQLLLRLQPSAAGSALKLRRFVRHTLNRRWRGLIRLARQWKRLSPEQKHDLRKRAKKLRYALEFFIPLYSRKGGQRTLKQLQQLQLALGSMNDGVVAHALLSQLPADDAALKRDRSQVADWLAQARPDNQAALRRMLKQLPRKLPLQ